MSYQRDISNNRDLINIELRQRMKIYSSFAIAENLEG